LQCHRSAGRHQVLEDDLRWVLLRIWSSWKIAMRLLLEGLHQFPLWTMEYELSLLTLQATGDGNSS
jgi:hypothetical protein